jgi:hypothetical protein
MGNQFSTTGQPEQTEQTEQKGEKGETEEFDITKPASSYEIIDYIATYYILTADYVSLTKLYDKEYCDKLVVLTSDIIERYFTDLEITYLAQRTKEGVIVNELDKDKLIFFEKKALDKLDIKNALKKKRVCQGIAKFYVKIAHVFAAIVRTVNPVYVYKDNEGNNVRANLYEKHTIPQNVPRQMYKMNICEMRINALRGKNDYTKTGPDDPITISPDFCSMNINDSGEVKNLMEEPGIPELEHLYYDDGYNYETGKFEKMSEKASEQYTSDLKLFYENFTGNSNMDESIKKFKDIRLRDFGKTELCNENMPKLKGTMADELFAKYADNLRQMVDNANKNQDKLTDIINKLFSHTKDPQTQKKVVRVNPELTEDELQKVVVEARELIINLYLTCEQDFETGVNIYKAIVEQLGLDTIQRQTETLERQLERKGETEEKELMVKNEDKSEVKSDVIEEKELMVKNEDKSKVLEETPL